MAEFEVMLQTEEANDYNVSVTGTVDGIQVAAVVLRASLPRAKTARDKALAEALIDAYLRRPKRGPGAAGIRVTRP